MRLPLIPTLSAFIVYGVIVGPLMTKNRTAKLEEDLTESYHLSMLLQDSLDCNDGCVAEYMVCLPSFLSVIHLTFNA